MTQPQVTPPSDNPKRGDKKSEETHQPQRIPKEDQKRCADQQENCLRIGTAFYIWDQHLRMRQAAWLATTILIAVFTMMQMLFEFGGERADLITGGLVLLTAGAFAGYFVFSREMPLDEIGKSANNFIGLSDKFQHTATMTPEESKKLRTETTEETFNNLMERFYKDFGELLISKETIWKAAPLAPQWCFCKASSLPPEALLGGVAYQKSAKSLPDEAAVPARQARGVPPGWA
jgi:hypothetical protein